MCKHIEMLPREVKDRLEKNGIINEILKAGAFNREIYEKTIYEILEEGLDLFLKGNGTGIVLTKVSQLVDSIKICIEDQSGNNYPVLIVDSLGSTVIDADAWRHLSMRHMEASILACPDIQVDKKKKVSAKNKPYYRGFGKKARWACG